MKKIDRNKNIVICFDRDFTSHYVKEKLILNSLNYNAISIYTDRQLSGKKGIIDKSDTSIYSFEKRGNIVLSDCFEFVKKSNSLLILNYEKNNIKGYVDSFSFLNMVFASILSKKVVTLNNVMNNISYYPEISLIKTISLKGNIKNISNYIY
jgi:hypothetical protein